MSFVLNDENFVLYAAKFYDNPSCKGLIEFEDDLKRFSYIKRLLNKPPGDIEQYNRLIINHIVILCNLFGPEALVNMLFFKLSESYWSYLKTYLIFLNIMPDGRITVGNKQVNVTDIPIDDKLASLLRKL